MALLWEAIAWAARGCKCFGLPLGSKVPDVSFPELATDDPAKLALIWRDAITGSKDLNIGVLCGDGILIIDIDTKHDSKFNRSAVANYLAMGGHFNTLVVKTASGGLQCYFRIPRNKSFRNMQSVVPGVDIRCENGYGIAPGSFSLESGGNYELHNDAPIADLPEAIYALLKPVGTCKERLNGHADAEIAVPLFIEYVQHVAPAIEGQGGDAHTYNVACMGVRDYGLTTVTVFNIMLEHFNPRCEPPWDADELQHKIENAEEYAIGETGSKDPEKILHDVEYTPPAVTALAPPVNGHAFEPSAPKQLTPAADIPQVDWTIYPLCVPRDVTMAVGPGGVGKSTFLVALACHAAAGKDFGPYKVKEAMDVLLYNPEDNIAQISGRAAVTCTQHGLNWDQVRDHLFIIDQESEMLTMVEADNGRNMRIPPATEKYITDYFNLHPTIRLFIVDPMRKVLSGINENDNAHMSQAMRYLNKTAQRLNVSMVMSHHTVKNLMLRKDLDADSPDLSVGAGSVVSSARQVMNVLPQTPEDVDRYGRHNTFFSTRISKSNHGPSGEIVWWERKVMRAANGGLYTTPVRVDISTVAQRMNSEYINYIGDDMTELGKNSMGVTEAAAILYKHAGQFQTNKALGETVRRLFDRGSTMHPYADIHGNSYMMMLETDGKRHEITLVEQSGFQTPPPATMILPKRQDDDDDEGPLGYLP